LSQLRLPTGGIARGQVFGYSQDYYNLLLPFSDEWISVGSAAFALATAGDSVILYCTEPAASNNYVVPLAAFTTGEWKEEFAESYSSNESALPPSLRLVGSVQTGSEFNSYVYAGTRTGTKTELLVAFRDERNWIGSDSEEGQDEEEFIDSFEVLLDPPGNTTIKTAENNGEYSSEEETTTTTSEAGSSSTAVVCGKAQMVSTLAMLAVFFMSG
jgi:hypothetical protein